MGNSEGLWEKLDLAARLEKYVSEIFSEQITVFTSELEGFFFICLFFNLKKSGFKETKRTRLTKKPQKPTVISWQYWAARPLLTGKKVS